MKIKEALIKTKNKLKNDYTFKTYIFASFSFFATLIFSVYNLYLGIAYKASWNLSISIYYLLLMIVRGDIFFNEKKLYKSNLDENIKTAKHKIIYLKQGFMLFLIDLILIVPITIMTLGKKSINYSTIPAIATATYTTCKIVLAIINFTKVKNQSNLEIKMFRNINLKDSLVALLTLQYVLVMTFGNGIEGSSLILCSITSFIVWLLLLTISIITIYNAIQLRKK